MAFQSGTFQSATFQTDVSVMEAWTVRTKQAESWLARTKQAETWILRGTEEIPVTLESSGDLQLENAATFGLEAVTAIAPEIWIRR
jgi:hypothetical protein